MGLYQKYRPTKWDDFIGNESELASLEGLFIVKEHPRVFLFSGPAGCGKTSLARFLGTHIGADNVVELNSADNRGIDTARDIINEIQYNRPSPTLYILDEVHQTSKDFQNAMLKVLEDTPPNIYFILCSSEPNKIIAAVKSRCTEVKMKPLPTDSIILLCRKVAKAEGKRVGIEVLEAVAEHSGGSPRNALVLLESIIDVEDVKKALDIVAQPMIESNTLELCRILLNDTSTWKAISSCVSNLETSDWESVRHAILGYMTSTLMSSGKLRAAIVMEEFSEPFYNTGKAGLVLACYRVYNSTKRR